jgi:cytochrome d ubiquinol oxidase subunit I
MDNLLAARLLMGISLAFHIVYATIGVGLPFMLMIAEGLSLRTGDDSWHVIARRWIRPAGVIFAIGAVSGTVLSFELGLLWPRFMALSGPVIGPAFTIEGFAFFVEAIFLALYLYGEHRLSRPLLFFCTVAMSVAAAASAAFVISANAWMNTPAGFRLENGRAAAIDFPTAFANPAWPHQAVHGTMAAYVATGFAVAGIYALAILRRRELPHSRKALTVALAVGTFFLPFMVITGDWAARFVGRYEKPKLAAMEAHFRTAAGADLVVGGWPDPREGRVRYGIAIPKGLSILAHRDPNAVVEGLDAFPAGTTPDPRLVHPFFNLMVGFGTLMLATSAAFWLSWWRGKRFPAHRPVLWGVVLSAPLGMLALEAGWLVTEFGRQPWTVMKMQTVAEGVTTRGGIDALLATFCTVYLLLTVAMLKLLLRPSQEAGPDLPQEVKHADL